MHKYHRHDNKRILFVCKTRNSYGHNTPMSISTGMFTSSSLVVDMLNAHHVEAKLVDVADNNGIDHEVAAFRPTICIIEALWVVPEKFIELRRRYPQISWVVRIHSEIPFLATEGIAMKWILEYVRQPNIYVAVNSPRCDFGLSVILPEGRLLYMPNYYPTTGRDPKSVVSHTGRMQIGCFGAIRPMKNMLSQAIAAIWFARNLGKPLDFHINDTRVEQGGAQCLRNLSDLFAEIPSHRLINNGWLPHDQFLDLVRTMDLAMQVSMSETFNIVAADCVDQQIPTLGSHEIDWLPPISRADPNDIDDICGHLLSVWDDRNKVIYKNLNGLHQHNSDAIDAWLDGALMHPAFHV